jgi:hypothetical protein
MNIMNPYTYNLTFRVHHPDRDLHKLYLVISGIDGLTPGVIWKVGDQKRTPRGDIIQGNYRNSFCSFDFFNDWQKSEVESLPSVMEKILDQLNEYKKILNEHVSDGGTLDMYASWYITENSGETLPVNLLRKLADLNIELQLDIYPPDVKKPAQEV